MRQTSGEEGYEHEVEGNNENATKQGQENEKENKAFFGP